MEKKLISMAFAVYKKNMSEEVADDLSGDFMRLMIALIKAERPEPFFRSIDHEKAKKEAQDLYDAADRTWRKLFPNFRAEAGISLQSCGAHRGSIDTILLVLELRIPCP